MNRSWMLSLCLALVACGSAEPNPYPPTMPIDPAAAPATSSVPTQSVGLADIGLSPADMDLKANPCDDFYQYACGGWLSRTEIPGDKSSYGRFTEISDRNEAELEGILTRASSGVQTDPVLAKIGTFFSACMDEASVEAAGTKPIDPLLKQVRKIRRKADVVAALTQLHAVQVWPLMTIGSIPDFKNATRNILMVEQGGLGLPDRDYYLKTEPDSVALRDRYVAHVTAMFRLAGHKAKSAKTAASDVLRIETALAKASKSRVELRDPAGVYNRVELAGLKKLVPSLPWDTYFGALKHPGMTEITVDGTAFLTAVEGLLATEKPAAWGHYFEWHLLHSTASLLPKSFVDEQFKLTQALRGTKEQRPRYKRCISATDSALKELVAQPFVKIRFSPEAKQAATAMVEGIRTAFAARVQKLPWMSDTTKQRALEKLAAMEFLIGYPDKWKTYDFAVAPKQYADNALAARAYELQRDLDKVGKPYDRKEWYFSPAIVNAGYNPLANQMTFPAGILQPVFFDAKAHIPVNLGGLGMVVGHELTHGFDDEGRQFDKDGNLESWWTEEDDAGFTARTECVIQQYGGFEPLPGAKLNGKLTLGENIADIGGVKLSFATYRAMRADRKVEYVADGLSEDQQFFVAVGQAWCSKYRDDEAKQRIVTDPHSPPRFRVNGSLANVPEFAEAFSCPAGSPMHPTSSCDVW